MLPTAKQSYSYHLDGHYFAVTHHEVFFFPLMPKDFFSNGFTSMVIPMLDQVISFYHKVAE